MIERVFASGFPDHRKKPKATINVPFVIYTEHEEHLSNAILVFDVSH